MSFYDGGSGGRDDYSLFWTVTLLSFRLMLLGMQDTAEEIALLGTLSVFAVCQVLSVISSGFTFLVLSRIGVACAHSIFLGDRITGCSSGCGERASVKGS